MVDAAVEGRLEEFRQQLSSDAIRTLGSAASMEAIRTRLAQFKNVSVGDALLVWSQKGDQGYGHTGDVLQRYEATVSGSPTKGEPPQLLYTLTVQCSLAYGVYHHDATPESCSTTIDADNIPWTNCTPGSDAYDSVDLGETCGVSDIR